MIKIAAYGYMSFLYFRRNLNEKFSLKKNEKINIMRTKI